MRRQHDRIVLLHQALLQNGFQVSAPWVAMLAAASTANTTTTVAARW